MGKMYLYQAHLTKLVECVLKHLQKLAGKKHPPVRIAVGLEYKLLMFAMRFVPDRLREIILRKMYLGE